MGSALSILNHLPPWEHLIHPTPEIYTHFLNIFQYFPLVRPHPPTPINHRPEIPITLTQILTQKKSRYPSSNG